MPKQTTPTIDFTGAEYYDFVHGHKPFGEGNWAFEIGGNKEPVWFYGKYGEAKKQARAKAIEYGRENNLSYVLLKVLS